MSRSRASAKQAGARFERVVADYLAEHVDDRIDRRVKTGGKDKGDIAGVRFLGMDSTDKPLRLKSGRVVIECKDCATIAIGPWLGEAETERVNDGADVGLVVSKRRGKGDPGDQLVSMTLRDLCTLLSGVRPE